MELIDSIQKIVKNYINSLGLTDMVIGTVTKIDPLEVTLVNSMVPLPSDVLVLTEAFKDRTIEIGAHAHQISTLSHGHSTNDMQTSSYSHAHPVPAAQAASYTHSHNITPPIDGSTLSQDTHGHNVPISNTESDSHSHNMPGRTTTNGLTGSYPSETAASDLKYYENGEEVPVVDGKIVLNRQLAINDKVIMLRVLKGQNFILLSRAE